MSVELQRTNFQPKELDPEMQEVSKWLHRIAAVGFLGTIGFIVAGSADALPLLVWTGISEAIANRSATFTK